MTHLPPSLLHMLLVEAFILATPLLFILADLVAGQRKARQRGEAITSNGWKRSVSKAAKYYNMLLALAVIDALQLAAVIYLDLYAGSHLPTFPWFTLLGAVAVGLIETKSILEPANQKERTEITELSNLARAIADHRGSLTEITEAITRYITQQQDKK